MAELLTKHILQAWYPFEENNNFEEESINDLERNMKVRDLLLSICIIFYLVLSYSLSYSQEEKKEIHKNTLGITKFKMIKDNTGNTSVPEKVSSLENAFPQKIFDKLKTMDLINVVPLDLSIKEQEKVGLSFEDTTIQERTKFDKIIDYYMSTKANIILFGEYKLTSEGKNINVSYYLYSVGQKKVVYTNSLFLELDRVGILPEMLAEEIKLILQNYYDPNIGKETKKEEEVKDELSKAVTKREISKLTNVIEIWLGYTATIAILNNNLYLMLTYEHCFYPTNNGFQFSFAYQRNDLWFALWFLAGYNYYFNTTVDGFILGFEVGYVERFFPKIERNHSFLVTMVNFGYRWVFGNFSVNLGVYPTFTYSLSGSMDFLVNLSPTIGFIPDVSLNVGFAF